MVRLVTNDWRLVTND